MSKWLLYFWLDFHFCGRNSSFNITKEDNGWASFVLLRFSPVQCSVSIPYDMSLLVPLSTLFFPLVKSFLLPNAIMMGNLVLFVVFAYSIQGIFAIKASESTQTVIEGSAIVLACASSFPPPWTWHGRNQKYKMLTATGLTPHPQLGGDDRYTFYSESSSYFLRIERISVLDAGKFICETGTPVSTLLNVVR